MFLKIPPIPTASLSLSLERRNAKQSIHGVATLPAEAPSENISEFQSNRDYDFPLNYIGRVAGDRSIVISLSLSRARKGGAHRAGLRILSYRGCRWIREISALSQVHTRAITLAEGVSVSDGYWELRELVVLFDRINGTCGVTLVSPALSRSFFLAEMYGALIVSSE